MLAPPVAALASISNSDGVHFDIAIDTKALAEWPQENREEAEELGECDFELEELDGWFKHQQLLCANHAQHQEFAQRTSFFDAKSKRPLFALYHQWRHFLAHS